SGAFLRGRDVAAAGPSGRFLRALDPFWPSQLFMLSPPLGCHVASKGKRGGGDQALDELVCESRRICRLRQRPWKVGVFGRLLRQAQMDKFHLPFFVGFQLGLVRIVILLHIFIFDSYVVFVISRTKSYNANEKFVVAAPKIFIQLVFGNG